MFDPMPDDAFDQIFQLDEENRQKLLEFARQQGADDAELDALLLGVIRMEMMIGGAHPADTMSIVVRALYVQGAQAITLRVSRESDTDHHLTIEVLEMTDRSGESPKPQGGDADEM